MPTLSPTAPTSRKSSILQKLDNYLKHLRNPAADASPLLEPLENRQFLYNNQPTFQDPVLAIASHEDQDYSLNGGFPVNTNDEGQSVLKWTVVGVGDSSLFAVQPHFDSNGNLFYTPATNVSGETTITITAQDSGGTAEGVDTTEPLTIPLSIYPVNDAPIFTAINPPSVNKGAPLQSITGWTTVSPGAPDESGQTVTFETGEISNPSIFSVMPYVQDNGTLLYQPSATAFGTSTVKVRAHDDGGTDNGGSDTSDWQTFTITVNEQSAAKTVVTYNGVEIPDDDSTPSTTEGTDFGTSYQSPGAITRTFTVTNPGDQALHISNLQLPDGFTLVEGLSAIIAPGKSDTFTVSLSTATAGNFNTGGVTFQTNSAEGIFVFSMVGIVVPGSFHTFTAKTAAKDRTFTDDNNNKVLFTLSGAGTGTLFQTATGEILSLALSGTKLTTNLNVNVTKNKNGTGVTTIGDIHIGDGGLNGFNAAGIHLTQSFKSEYTIKSLTLGDVGGDIQVGIVIGGDYIDKTTYLLGALDDVYVRTSSTVTSFKAQDWQDNDSFRDGLEAASLGTLTLTGRNEVKTKGEVTTTKLYGDLDADILLTYVVPIGTAPNSPAAKPTVSSITVAGSATGGWDFRAHKVSAISAKGLSSGQWNAKAGFGSITLGSANELSIASTKDLASFKAGLVEHTTIDVDGNIGSINVAQWNDGLIIATKVTSITTTGRVATKALPALAGDFNVDMLVNAGIGAHATLPAVGSITIKGSAQGDNAYQGNPSSGDWIIAGGAGAIRIGGSTDHLTIDVRSRDTNRGNLASLTITGEARDTVVSVYGKSGAISVGGATHLQVKVGVNVFGGDLASFNSTKALEGTTLEVEGNIGAITTYNWDGGSIHAFKIASITSRTTPATKAVPAVQGNWNIVGIHVTGEGVKTNQLAVGPINIAGQVNASTWEIHGNAGAVTVGSFYNSTLFVGIDGDAPTNAAPVRADFELFGGKASTLAGFTVTGKNVTAGHASFSASFVAAGTLTNVSLKLVNIGSLNAYGFSAATKIGLYTRLTGNPAPNNIVRVANKTAPGTYDTAGLFTLKIVG
jgi:hypothetical protein